MPNDTSPLDGRALVDLAATLGSMPASSPSDVGVATLDDVASFDFAYYDCLLPISSGYSTDPNGPSAPQTYPFEIAPPLSVNIGLRLIYRQQWRPLGRQPGEIVRTIPLGPGQKERVTIKVSQRQKRTRTEEVSSGTEATTETSDTTKTSSEVVAEWSADWKSETTEQGSVEGGIDLGFLSSSASYSQNTSTSEAAAERSRNTTSALSEAMRRTASKMRRESKVVVATETESSVERETFSEISNPNNESPVTYEYRRIQQQYEIFTHLAVVESVVFVAEEVPDQVDEDWILKHDWILAKALRDESFREALNDVIRDADEIDPTNPGGAPTTNPGDLFQSVMEKVRDNFAHFTNDGGGGQGLTIPDIYGEPQRIYQTQLKERSARARANQIRGKKRTRLFKHIRQNILYYLRAIWSHEDPEQRVLRYKKENRRVPMVWRTSRPTVGGAAMSFEPTTTSAPLWDLIEPAGPIGYFGNYAVFRAKPLPASAADARVEMPTGAGAASGPRLLFSLGFVMHELRRPYLGDRQTMGGRYAGKLLDPALRSYFAETRGRTFADLTDEDARDVASYVPSVERIFARDAAGRVLFDSSGRPVVLRDAQGITDAPSDIEYAEYLYRKSSSRRFLMDSNNLYLTVRAGEGAALEPFKRAHRYIDVLKEYENLQALSRKNERRAAHVQEAQAFDPDIEKVIVVGDAASFAAAHAAHHAAWTSGAPSSSTSPGDGAPTAPTTGTPAPTDS